MNNNLLILQQEAINENTSPERLDELADISELAHLVAENVNSSPETLTKLAENSNEDILKALVSNPSTPTEILIKLGDKFPQELVNNPIVDLWLLEDDNPLYCYNQLTAKLARNPNTPINL
ncbi:MAG: HEAT repeat domain-containing protein, partial [Crocosphaera sp.]|nr:HEAT repeat domain-containing protein [Crocosphaera sp.]